MNTIFYKLERESNTLRERESEIAELCRENEEYEEELRVAREGIEGLGRKLELFETV